MPAYLDRRLNRLIRRVSTTPAEAAQTALVVDIKIDPSQQLKLYGVDFGYELFAQADRAVILFGPCAGFLSIDASSINGVNNPDLNAGLDIPFYGSISDGNEIFKAQDLSNPTIINGDRSVTFVLYPPFTSAALTGTVGFLLNVRGEITQVQGEDKRRLGDWTLR